MSVIDLSIYTHIPRPISASMYTKVSTMYAQTENRKSERDNNCLV